MCIDTSCFPRFAGFKQDWIKTIFCQKHHRNTESENSREELMKMTETEVHTFFALGGLQREVFQITR